MSFNPCLGGQLGSVFSIAGYSEALSDAAALAASGFGRTAAGRLAGVLSEESQLRTLARLFFLCHPVKRTTAERALLPLSLADLARGGLLRVSQESVRSMVRISPHQGLLVAFHAEPHGSDQVHGVAGASLTLAALTVRRSNPRALDLGTGGGFQAMLATRHTEHVLATDVNSQALDLARFAAALNGIENVRWLLCDWYESIGRSRFELIVANPPYVISPDRGLRFRDSGALGADLCGRVIAQAPDHLVDGGFASILCNWPHERGGDGSGPIGRWVHDHGCDTIVVNYGSEDPAQYAERWNPPERYGASSAGRKETIRRWIRYYEQIGIEAIAFGAVVLRRRSSPGNWLHTLSPTTGPVGSGSHQLMRIFSGVDYCRAHRDDMALMNDSFQLSADYRVQRAAGSQLLLSRLGLRATVDPPVLEVLETCDAGGTLADAIGSVSERSGTAPAELVAASSKVVRSLLEAGLMHVANDHRASGRWARSLRLRS